MFSPVRFTVKWILIGGSSAASPEECEILDQVPRRVVQRSDRAASRPLLEPNPSEWDRYEDTAGNQSRVLCESQPGGHESEFQFAAPSTTANHPSWNAIRLIALVRVICLLVASHGAWRN